MAQTTAVLVRRALGAGLAAGVLLGGLVWLLDGTGGDAGTTPAGLGSAPVDEQLVDEQLVDDLVQAWRRHRSGTFVVDSDWRRTKVEDGATLHSATRLVQRPPDRIQRQLGSVRGRLDGSPVRCSTDPVGDYRCFPSAHGVPDWDAEIDEEVAALRSYVTGDRPLYRLTGDGAGCFDLELLRAYPDPPYGRRGRLCFDPGTGALRLLRRELDRITEEQEAHTIRTEVTDADFDLSQDPDFDPQGLPDPGSDQDGSLGPAPPGGSPAVPVTR